MTTTGLVFRGYAEAIIERHGFGSNKMVYQWDNNRRERLCMRGQRLVNKGNWANEKFEILESEYDEAMRCKEQGLRIWDEVGAADKYLLENGYIREYTFHTYNTVAGTGVLCNHRMHTKYGLTAKGWQIANKYLAAQIDEKGDK